jgi:REP element-mobilizing transposase RayT
MTWKTSFFSGSPAHARLRVGIVIHWRIPSSHLHYLPVPDALAYLITFTCYGARLPGNSKGSISHHNTLYDTPILGAHRPLESVMERNMNHPSVTLGPLEREIVLEAISEICQIQSWSLLAAHVRTNHVHTVVAANTTPERIMVRIKARASQRLNQCSAFCARRWTRHGSTRYLRNEISVAAAIQYVIDGQGTPMSVYSRPVQHTPHPEPRTQ